MKNMGMLLALFLFVAQPVVAETITVTFSAGDTEHPPHIMGKGDSFPQDKPGVTVEMLRMLEQQLDITVHFKRHPHLRSIKYLKDGTVDGMFTWSFQEKRREAAVFPMVGDQPDTSKRMFIISYVVYTLKDSTVEWDGNAFTNVEKGIGVLTGYSIIDVLREKHHVNVDEAGMKHISQNFKKLLHHRISAVVELEMAGDIVVNSSGQFKNNIIKISPPFATKPYYLVFSHHFVKKHPELAEKIWSALAEIREKHLYRLMEEYIHQ